MSYNVPAGTYVIGDLSLNLTDDQYDEYIKSSDNHSQGGFVTVAGKQYPVYAFETESLNGTFFDQKRFEYVVHTSAIGIMPLAVLENRGVDEFTKKVTFKHAVDVFDSSGLLVFGTIEIDTNDIPENDEDDFEDSLFGDNHGF